MKESFVKGTGEIQTNVKEKKQFDIQEFFLNNKTVIYSVIFYAIGIFCGSAIFLKCRNENLDAIIGKAAVNDFLQLFINNLCFYMLIYAITVLLGICLVGFPVINLIPFIIGFESGLKTTYYYTAFQAKGFGYNLLMVAPFICTFLTVIIFAISISYELSKSIYEVTVKKEEKNTIEYKKYLKKYLLYAIMIVCVSLINTGITVSLGSIVSL